MSDSNDQSAKSSDQRPDQEQVSREAYRMADMVRDGKMTKDGALRELKERCPGLTDADYEKAFARGLFESLW